MKSRILVVDDEDIVLKSCVRALADPEYEVDTAMDGAAALERIDTGAYDVVVLDIMMPGVNGLEVLQRAKEAHPEVEIVMVTGLSQIDTAVRSIKLGAFDYLAKPFDPDELKLTVDRAIEQKGSITVRTRLRDGRAEIAIEDTGCGIGQKDLPRIFDPFFTTKEVGKGTGLGLAVSHGIVEAHGGTIEVESTPGEGTTFRVLLPLAPEMEVA